MSPLDDTVRINGVSFEVIGVLQLRMEEQGGSNDINKLVLIPFTAMDSFQDIYVEFIVSCGTEQDLRVLLRLRLTAGMQRSHQRRKVISEGK
jgi:hypothetical protein